MVLINPGHLCPGLINGNLHELLFPGEIVLDIDDTRIFLQFFFQESRDGRGALPVDRLDLEVHISTHGRSLDKPFHNNGGGAHFVKKGFHVVPDVLHQFHDGMLSFAFPFQNHVQNPEVFPDDRFVIDFFHSRNGDGRLKLRTDLLLDQVGKGHEHLLVLFKTRSCRKIKTDIEPGKRITLGEHDEIGLEVEKKSKTG